MGRHRCWIFEISTNKCSIFLQKSLNSNQLFVGPKIDFFFNIKWQNHCCIWNITIKLRHQTIRQCKGICIKYLDILRVELAPSMHVYFKQMHFIFTELRKPPKLQALAEHRFSRNSKIKSLNISLLPSLAKPQLN